MKIPTPVAKVMNDIWRDIRQMDLEREEAAAKSDPVKHRLSKTIRGGLGYGYYYAGMDGRGCVVRFCYSKNKNVAGYFLIWREVCSKQGYKRDQWDSTTNKRSATSCCERLAKAWKEEHQKAA